MNLKISVTSVLAMMPHFSHTITTDELKAYSSLVKLICVEINRVVDEIKSVYIVLVLEVVDVSVRVVDSVVEFVIAGTVVATEVRVSIGVVVYVITGAVVSGGFVGSIGA